MRTLLLALLFLSAPAYAADFSADDIARLEVLKRYGQLGQDGDYEAQAALWAPGAINNGREVSVEEIRSQLEDIHRTFPDHLNFPVEITVQGELIIVLQWTSGTHMGTARTSIYGGMLRDVKPTNKKFTVLRAHWWHIRDGKITSHQVVSDDLSMMRQLGLIPDSLPAAKQEK